MTRKDDEENNRRRLEYLDELVERAESSLRSRIKIRDSYSKAVEKAKRSKAKNVVKALRSAKYHLASAEKDLELAELEVEYAVKRRRIEGESRSLRLDQF